MGDITAEQFRKLKADQMSESQLQGVILALAGQYGWLRMHPRRAKVQTARGPRHMTPLSGDSGFWDLTLVHEGHPWMIFTELKREGGYPTKEQRRWLDAAAQHRCESCYGHGTSYSQYSPSIFVGVLRPAQWFAADKPIHSALTGHGPSTLIRAGLSWPNHR